MWKPARFVYRWQQRRLERTFQRRIYDDLNRISKDYAPRFAAAKDAIEFDSVLQAYLKECLRPDVQLEVARSRRLRRRAWQLGIEAASEAWEYDEATGHRYLSPAGRRQLAHEMRTERLDVVKRLTAVLIPVIAVLTGLLGVLIALILAWRH
jgi:hypothetical protein